MFIVGGIIFAALLVFLNLEYISIILERNREENYPDYYD